MINTKFEAYKIKREMKRIGRDIKVFRAEKNKYNEPTDDERLVSKFKAIYHEQTGNIQITTGDTTQSRTSKLPALLCLYEDGKNLQINDIIYLNNKKYNIAGIVNVQEWNIVIDISLEVVDDGRVEN